MTYRPAEVVPARDRTRETLFQLVRSGEATSRAALADTTGMSRSAVNAAVAKLIEGGRLIEAGEEPKGVGSGSGRPRATLVPAPNRAVVGAIDFGHDHITVALGDGSGRSLTEERYEIDVDLLAAEAMDTAASRLGALAAAHGVDELDAVVAGIPGPLDSSTGLVCSATILSSWVGLNPAAELGRRLGTTVHPENDAVLGALGELRAGPRRDPSTFLYVRATAGLGAALVLNGSPFRGATGLAGEIGHTPLEGRGEHCRCGRRGCLEAVVSVQAVLERIRHSHPSVPVDQVTLTHPADGVTDRILAEVGNTLGETLAMFCNLINPSALILGGELGSAGPVLLEGVAAGVRRQAQPATAAAVEIAPAAMGVRSEIVGALHAAAQLVR